MEQSGIKELIEVARTTVGSSLNKELKPEEFQGILAALAVHLEKIRQNFLFIDPNIKDTSEKVPETSGHLMDIDSTLSTAADRLMALTEGLATNHERIETLLNRLLKWEGGLNASNDDGAARATINEIVDINKRNRDSVMEIFANLSFQDLAGQKIKKMRSLIEGMEARLLEVLLIFGHNDDKAAQTKKEQMLKGLKEGGALKQELVDGILKDFGF